MNNIEPYRMADARSFTDYRQNHETNKQVKKFVCNSNTQCCKNNYNYKVCLVNSSESVKQYLENDYFKNNYLLFN